MLKKEKKINSHLLKWYSQNRRDFAWRKLYKNNLPSPYYVFVSEYMLQQTSVNSVKERFNEFIIKWPNLDRLANCKEPQILKFWSGLGYYSRARNLLKSAKIIRKNFNSKIPNNYDDLITLPGIGDYTAKAILGIAYNQPVMPTDVNIERILVRLFSLEEPIIKIKEKIKKLANTFVSKKSSSNLIQAFMDYGSIICVPRNPKCNVCIINYLCDSRKKNLQSLLPVKLKNKSKKPIKYTRAYVLIKKKINP
jgi:A/G-specific DNA glycosylase